MNRINHLLSLQHFHLENMNILNFAKSKNKKFGSLTIELFLIFIHQKIINLVFEFCFFFKLVTKEKDSKGSIQRS
jgi:hypothetical protein